MRAPAPLRDVRPGRWLGVAPFLLFTALFLILPTLYIVVGAFRASDGSFTFENILGLNTPSIRNAYWVSIRISFWSALLGCAIGLAMAAAVTQGGVPRGVRGPLMTFSGVASNFAGVPLAFAFIATLGLPQLNPVNEEIRRRVHSLFEGDVGYDYTYLYPGLQKVVQAAGRVIRSEHDEGVVYLIDDRFERATVRRLLPRWWRVEACRVPL